MDKRTFLKTIGAVAAGVTFSGNQLLAGNAEPKRRKTEGNQLWLWIGGKSDWTDEQIKDAFTKIKEYGFDGVCSNGDLDYFKRLAPVTKSLGLQLHAWYVTMNHPGDKEAQKHPEWYQVSREGYSCLEKRPYVDYYQWLCPSQEAVYQYIESQVMARAAIDGVDAVHLDYIRYPDVILPIGLQPKYNLVQDHEFPEYDFCYCDTCKQKFKDESGQDLDEMEDPTKSKDWRQFRYDRITRLVNRLTEKVHQRGKKISAAVFPYPDLARTICRQSWDDWNLDVFFPMIYNNFYNEDARWVGKATRKCVRDLKGKAELISGLYLPAFSTNAEMESAIHFAKKNGAAGIAIFDYNGMKDNHWNLLKTLS